MLQFFIRIFALMSFINLCHSEDIPSVSTKLGTITGRTKSVTFQKNEYHVDRYLGIPYAKPPTGELRFRRPEPYGPFSETYNAVEFGASCPQATIPFLPAEKKTDEDCLFLNVFVPRQEADEASGHAVMFFIHGGGFSVGSAYYYDGSVLSSVGNVIVVTINYRIGLLGFLDIDDEKEPGNFGLLDQRLALQWVNENIGAFSGDKDRVTIFGESAGSMSVGMQMMYPPNKGLFRSGIAESGGLSMPGMYLENNINVAEFYAKNLSCSVETLNEVMKCLKEASSESIIKVYKDTLESGGYEAAASVGAIPTIDGSFIKSNLNDMLRKSATESFEEIDFFRSIKLINGLNGKEGASIILMFGDADAMEDFEVSREEMNTQHIPGALSFLYGEKTLPEVVTQLLISEYTDWESPDDPKRLRMQMIDLYGDIFLNTPSMEMSRAHSNASNVDSYMYHFLPKLDKAIVQVPDWVQFSNHGDELGPVFGYHFDSQEFFNISDYTPPEWELNLSKRMMKFWSNFAKTGDPNKQDSESSVVWPKYDVMAQSYIKFDREDSIGQYLFARQTEFWGKIIPAVLDATEHAQTLSSQFGKKEDETCEKDGTCG